MKITEITSSENRIFKLLESLLSSKGITKNQRALISGKKVVGELMREKRGLVEALIFPFEKNTSESLGADSVDSFFLKKDLFNQIDVFGTHEPIALVTIPELEKDPSTAELRGCTLVVPFQEPSNVGSVLRSAAAFGIENIFLTEEAAHPFHPRSTRASSGAVFHHRFFSVSKLNDFRFERVPIVALDMTGETLHTFVFPSEFILVPGLEGIGVPSGFETDFRITIPVTKKVESLNGPTATAITLFKWFTSR